MQIYSDYFIKFFAASAIPPNLTGDKKRAGVQPYLFGNGLPTELREVCYALRRLDIHLKKQKKEVRNDFIPNLFFVDKLKETPLWDASLHLQLLHLFSAKRLFSYFN